jgi:succinylglutamate desuccinylase
MTIIAADNTNRYKLFVDSKTLVLRSSLILISSIEDNQSSIFFAPTYTQALKAATHAYHLHSSDYSRLQGVLLELRKAISHPIITNNIECLERALNNDIRLMHQRANNKVIYLSATHVLNLSLMLALGATRKLSTATAVFTAVATSVMIVTYGLVDKGTDLDCIGAIDLKDNLGLSDEKSKTATSLYNGYCS